MVSLWSAQTAKLESSFPTYESLEDVLVLDVKDPKVSHGSVHTTWIASDTLF